jgi:hypothetical protein
MVPTLQTPPVLTADATQADKDATKNEEDVVVAMYDQKVRSILPLLRPTGWI